MELDNTIKKALNEFHLISDERKKILHQLTDFVSGENALADLIFICTHNSRRSHLSQVWAQVAANYFGYFGVTCYSGGTEATAFFPSAIQALENAGLKVKKLSQDPNPVYAIKYNVDIHPIICFSKKFDDEFQYATRYWCCVAHSHG